MDHAKVGTLQSPVLAEDRQPSGPDRNAVIRGFSVLLLHSQSMDEEIDRAAATGAPAIVNNTAEHRFEAGFPEGLAILRYHYDTAHRLVLVHTEVPPLLRHKGIATQLAAAALDFARDRELVVVPVCPFVVAYLQQHPEFNALIAPRRAARS